MINMDDLVPVWVKRSVKKELLQIKLDSNLKNLNEVIVTMKTFYQENKKIGI
jgi:hypothetical protein